MKGKIFNTIIILMVLYLSGCIKETYDLNKLSEEVQISPVFAFPVATGDLTFADILKPNDTVRYESDNFVKIVVRKDSVVFLKLEDYYDFSNLVSYKKGFELGDVEINDFQTSTTLKLNDIIQYFSPTLRQQFIDLDDGQPHDFPSFPVTDLGEHSFPVIVSFENVLFGSGILQIGVTNNLTAPLKDIKIRLYTNPGHIQVGTEKTITGPIYPGATKTAEIDLSGAAVKNSFIAAIILTGSDGASNVIIDLDHTVVFSVNGYNLKIKAGRAIIKDQILDLDDDADTVDVDLGEDIEIERAKIKKGTLQYKITSKSNVTGSVSFALPTSSRNNNGQLTEMISVPPQQTTTGSVDLSNISIDLSTDPGQPYNRLPVTNQVKIGSNNIIIDYSMYDSIYVTLDVSDAEVDFVKGYFGQREEQIKPDTIDTELEDILEKISGEFHISKPSVKVNYSNSFGIPVEVTLNAKGKRDNKIQNLNLAPFVIINPVDTVVRDVSSVFTIDGTNSSLPDLISLPPVEAVFTGSAKMNPAGSAGGRNNYVFGNSRLLASLEIEVPLELWINNLQFADTVDNFLKSEENEEEKDSPFRPENMEYFRIKITTSNGFPLEASIELMLYDTVTGRVLDTISAPGLIKPALVDASGKVVSPVETVTEIEFDKRFFEASKDADKIIFIFKLVTSGGGTKDVKFYSDYMISYKATINAKPKFIFNK